MKEYIEREAALAICEQEYQERLKQADWCGDTVAWNIGGAIKGLPAADVVPVVRCRECKFYREFRTKRYNQLMRLCYRMGKRDMEYPVKPDDFCSRGERKADD